MQLKGLALLIIASAILGAFAQDAAAEPPRVELDQEAIENIMRTVSPGCRTEIESAMESKSDITVECQTEIQNAIQSLNIKPKTTKPKRAKKEPKPESAEGDASANAEEEKPKSKRSKKAPKQPDYVIHPAVTALSYVVLIAGGIFAYWKYNLAEKAEQEEEAKSSGKKKVSSVGDLICLRFADLYSMCL